MNLDELPRLDAHWQEALATDPRALRQPGLLACRFVVRGAMRTAGKRWRQGPRVPPLPVGLDDFSLDALSTRHVFRVEAQVARALNLWAHDQRRLHVRFTVPSPLELLAFQARGERIVSLLPDGVPTGHEPNAFEFALHDLCHAEKFFDAEHYLGQVGFFARVHDALTGPLWPQLTAAFDASWPAELHHVAADMNGSPLFLFAALRRKVMNAAQRAGQDPGQARDLLCSAMQLPEEVAESAVRFTVHPEVDPAETRHRARILLADFEAVGALRLAAAHASEAGLPPQRTEGAEPSRIFKSLSVNDNPAP